jgi:ribosome-interacting GTPase 1
MVVVARGPAQSAPASIPYPQSAQDGPRTVPANLTPDYKAAEAAFRKARDPQERLECLREMLRLIPKHKGTDHLQGDIKRRIKELSEELDRPRRGGARSGPAIVIRPEGAAQIALVGPPNSGKSSLHARLTGSASRVAPYPYTTQHPEPGMMPFEDVHYQLVDLPPIGTEHAVPWIASTLQTADGALLVVDLAEPDCVERLDALHAILKERRVRLTERWEETDEETADDAEALTLAVHTLLLVNKSDRLDDPETELRAFRELTKARYPALVVSAQTGHGLAAIGPWLFEHLGLVRVYTKLPGKPADRDRPFTLRRGGTVADVARLVHKDLARSLRHARLWGSSGHDGQHVGPEHVLADGDVVELH